MRSAAAVSSELLRSNSEKVEMLSACCDDFNSFITLIKTELDCFKSKLTVPSASLLGLPSKLPVHVNTKPPPTPPFDCSMNLLLFGVKEQSIVGTTAFVDEAFHHLIGDSVGISDIFKKQVSGLSPSSRPRPVLVKLSSVWQKRLILSSKFKLKEFGDGEVYVREDLSPEQREKRKSGHKLLSNGRNGAVSNGPQHRSSLGLLSRSSYISSILVLFLHKLTLI